MTRTFPFHLLIGFTTLQRRRSEMAESSKYNLTQFFLSVSRQSLHNILKQAEKWMPDFCWGHLSSSELTCVPKLARTDLTGLTASSSWERMREIICCQIFLDYERAQLYGCQVEYSPNISQIWVRTIICSSSWILTSSFSFFSISSFSLSSLFWAITR